MRSSQALRKHRVAMRIRKAMGMDVEDMDELEVDHPIRKTNT